MEKVADGWSFRLCCLHCLWAWRWCSASSCLLLGTTRLCGLVPVCTVPRCLSSGEREKKRGLVARGPGTHRHSPDLAPPTVRMPQGTPSMTACWRRYWKRQDRRTPTCRIVPRGDSPEWTLPLSGFSFPVWALASGPQGCLQHPPSLLGTWEPPHFSIPGSRVPTALSRPAPVSQCPQPCPTPRAPECTQPTVCWFSVPEFPADVAKILASGNWTLESPSPACQCSRPGARLLLPDCPAAAGGPPPPQALTSSGEVVQNLTGWNLSDFLVKTYPRLVHQG